VSSNKNHKIVKPCKQTMLQTA